MSFRSSLCRNKDKYGATVLTIRASGISPEQDELVVLVEEIIERGKVAKEKTIFPVKRKKRIIKLYR